jgi:hypothetical protein
MEVLLAWYEIIIFLSVYNYMVLLSYTLCSCRAISSRVDYRPLGMLQEQKRLGIQYVSSQSPEQQRVEQLLSVGKALINLWYHPVEIWSTSNLAIIALLAKSSIV